MSVFPRLDPNVCNTVSVTVSQSTEFLIPEISGPAETFFNFTRILQNGFWVSVMDFALFVLVIKCILLSSSEYYFSHHNLERDFFLRRKMNAQGFLPISLIASFHRVQALTTDVSLIMEVKLHHQCQCCNLTFVSNLTFHDKLNVWDFKMCCWSSCKKSTNKLEQMEKHTKLIFLQNREMSMSAISSELAQTSGIPVHRRRDVWQEVEDGGIAAKMPCNLTMLQKDVSKRSRLNNYLFMYREQEHSLQLPFNRKLHALTTVKNIWLWLPSWTWNLCFLALIIPSVQALKSSTEVELVGDKIRCKTDPEHWPIPTPPIIGSPRTDFSQLINCPEFVPRQTVSTTNSGQYPALPKPRRI